MLFDMVSMSRIELSGERLAMISRANSLFKARSITYKGVKR